VLNQDPFLHTSTFAGAPLAMAAAHAAVTTIDEEGIVDRAHELGQRLLADIRALDGLADGEISTDVRGRGLLIGIEFTAPHLAAEFAIELLDRRVISNHALNNNHVVRLTPPAVLSEGETHWLLQALHDSANAVRHGLRQEAA
jgi:putrescine aminotransferase